MQEVCNFIKKEAPAQVFSYEFCEISKKTQVFLETLAASVVRRNTKHKKDENTRTESKEIWKKSKRNRMSCFNIYIIVFAFLSSTVEVMVEVEWNVCFWNTFDLLCLAATTFMKRFQEWSNNIRLTAFRLFLSNIE